MAEYRNEDDAVRHLSAYPDLQNDLLEQDFQRRRVAACAAFVRPKDLVLEVGCNSGYFGGFCPQAKEVHGVDVNPRLVAIAATLLTTAQVARAEALPFPDKTFDFVHLGGVLELVYDPLVVLREAARVSRRSVAGTTPHADGSWGLKRIPIHPWQMHSFTEVRLRELLEKIGKIVNFGTVNVNRPEVFFFEVHVVNSGDGDA